MLPLPTILASQPGGKLQRDYLEALLSLQVGPPTATWSASAVAVPIRTVARWPAPATSHLQPGRPVRGRALRPRLGRGRGRHLPAQERPQAAGCPDRRGPRWRSGCKGWTRP